MSGLIVGLVLRTPITDSFNSDAKFIATVYADHAWEDGSHAYPAVATVATITGLSERTVQRYLRILEEIGMLVVNGKGPRGTNKYDFPLVASTDGSVRLAIRGGDSLTPPVKKEQPADSGDTQSPRQAVRGDTVSGDTVSGDSIVSPKQTTRPLKIKEEEEIAPQIFEITEKLQDELKDLGIYISVWNDVESRLANGWVEADIFALIRWMKKTSKDKTQAAQRFVKRVREGTKAPKEFYPIQRDVDQQEDATAVAEFSEVGFPYDYTITPQIQTAWKYILDQLSQGMDRGAFMKHVRDTAPVHFKDGELQIGTWSHSSRDWLESRLTTIAENHLIGAMKDKVTVEFVVVDAVAVETEVA